MKRKNLFSSIWLMAIFGVLITSMPSNAFAIGTHATTTITTQAQASYQSMSGISSTRTAKSAEVTLTVAYKVVVGLTANNIIASTPDGTTVTSEFTVTNNGNFDDVFSLNRVVTGLTTGWVVTLHHDSLAGALVLNDTVHIAENASQKIVAEITIPSNPTNTPTQDGHTYSFVVNVASATSTSATPAPGTGALSTTKVIGQAASPFNTSITIHKPVLSFSVLQSPVTSGGIVSPGQLMHYVLTITNSGTLATTAGATVAWLYDNAKFQTSTVSISGGSTASAADGTASWTIPPLASESGSAILVFEANINDVQIPGSVTLGSTGSQVTYGDGTTTPKVLSVTAPTTFSIRQVNGFEIIQLTPNSLQDPGALQVYHIKVKNWGNTATDGFTFSQVRNGGTIDTVHKFYVDSLTSVTAITDPVTGIAAGATVDYFIRLTVPDTATMGSTIIRTITVTTTTSSPNTPLRLVAETGGGSNSIPSLTTTVQAALVTMTLEAIADGPLSGSLANPAPGDIIIHEVTITNGGNRAAVNIISNNLGSFPGAVTIGAVDADTSGGDYSTSHAKLTVVSGGGIGTGTFEGGSVTVTASNVAVSITNIPPGQVVKYRYRIKI